MSDTTNTTAPVAPNAVPEKPKLPLLDGNEMDAALGEQYRNVTFKNGDQEVPYRLYLKTYEGHGLKFYCPQFNTGDTEEQAANDIIAATQKYGATTVREFINSRVHAMLRTKITLGSVPNQEDDKTRENAIKGLESINNGIIFDIDKAMDWAPGSREKTSTGWFKLFKDKRDEVKAETDPEKKRELFGEMQQLQKRFQEALEREQMKELGMDGV